MLRFLVIKKGLLYGITGGTAGLGGLGAPAGVVKYENASQPAP
jgi:hypothetical protein